MIKNIAIIIICFFSCTNRYCPNVELMFPFLYFDYPRHFVSDGNKFELNLQDSIAYLNSKLYRNTEDSGYNFKDTLKPYYGSACTKYGSLYGCPCSHSGGVFGGGNCDCENCLEKSKTIIFYRGKLSQVYISGHGYMVCDIEDTVGQTIYMHRTFKIKLENMNQQIIEKLHP